MDQIINIFTALSGLYMITYLIDSLFETPKDLKTLKFNKLRHLDAYNIIDNFATQDTQSNSNIDNIDEILEKLSYPSELKEIIITFKNYIDPINLGVSRKMCKF